MNKCKYCGSENLYLENKTNRNIMELPQVALKCANCGKWLKWCPKEERQQYIKDNENKTHLLSEVEYQQYCAYKLIEPQIKGCMDREKEYQRQLEEKDKEIAWYDKSIKDQIINGAKFMKKSNQDKINFAVAKLKKIKEWCEENCHYVEECCGDVASDFYEEYVYKYINIVQLFEFIDQQIEEINNTNDGG